ncbi:MAG: phosphotransferase family protein [Proteobacteria bacterium]|nr:phosphotransferase family protein [Pseudomonadota bacterium]
MSSSDDAANDIRKGEELDAAGLEEFLRDSIDGLEGSLTIKQFPGGHSNLTYSLSFGDREMVLRRPPIGSKVKAAHDMKREYTVLKALDRVFPYTPRPLAFTEDTSIVGSPFYVMERLQGYILRRSLPKGVTLSAAQARELCRSMMKVLAQLHSLDYRKIGLEDFGKPEGYVERQVKGWMDRYRDARTPDVPDGEDVMAWLEANRPPDAEKPSIVHGDWKPDNIVLDTDDPTQVVGVLDWEMATIGDPFMDAAFTMIFFNEEADLKAVGISASLPAILRESVSREEMLRYYQEFSGRSIENPDYYYVFNMFRLAGLLQQIYYRFYHGITKDPRFQVFQMSCQLLIGSAQQLIARSGR